MRTDGQSTEMVLEYAFQTAREKGIEHIIIATTRGTTGLAAMELQKEDHDNLKIIAVTHSTGFREPGQQELPLEVRKKLESAGIRVITGTMPFHGISDALRKSRSYYSAGTAIADALRMLGQGTKVCVEIACMAVDAGLVPEDEDVITMAGTHFGADTILLINAVCTRRILETRIREVIAKPADW